jgi:hypothetical protein
MTRGQKVVCINDTFTASIKKIYKALPVKGVTYTIREVYLGREKLRGSDQATVGLLLEELINAQDPRHVDGQELGFSSERFAPLEHDTEDSFIEEELAVPA